MYIYRKMKQFFPLIILPLALLILAACGGADQTPTPIDIDVTEGIEGTVVVEPTAEPEVTDTVEPAPEEEPTAEEAETEPAEEPATPTAEATEPAETPTE